MDDSPENVRAARLEALAFALVAILPIVPYVALLLGRGVARFELSSDLAQMELDTRRCWTGDTLVGLASRFRWSHPGPLLFYVTAPFEKAFGTTSTGFYLGTAFVSCAAAASCVVATRLLVGRAHALSVLAGILAWLAAFGNVTANPWVRVVVGLPLLATFVLAALLARGASIAAIPAVFFGALAAQTHLSTVPSVAVVWTVGVGAFLVVARRRGGVTRRERRVLAIAAALLVVTSLPPVLDELRGGADGNISKLVRFFRDRTEPYQPLEVALRDFVNTTGWLPDRLLSGRLAEDDAVPFAMRWDSVPVHLSRTATTITAVYFAAMIGAAVVAWRRRDATSLAFLGFGALGNVLAIAAARAIVGEVMFSLLFWMTAPQAVGWIGVISSFGGALASLPAFTELRAQRGRQPEGPKTDDRRRARLVVVGTLLALAASATHLQRVWIARFPFGPASDPDGAAYRRQIYDAIRAEIARDASVPVIHTEGAWFVANAMVLELDKDGVDFRVVERDRWNFPGAHPPAPGERARHVWIGTPSLPPPSLACATRFAVIDIFELLAASDDIASCPQ